MYLVDLSFISDGNPSTVEVDWPEHKEVPCWPYFYMTGNAINHVPHRIHSIMRYSSQEINPPYAQLLSFQGHPFPIEQDQELCEKLHKLDYFSSER